MGKWKNRHDKPFDCKWTNDKVFALGLWIGKRYSRDSVHGTAGKSQVQGIILETPKTFTHWEGSSIQVMV